MKTIIVTGSVSTGKTTFSKKLSNKLGYPCLDVNKFIKQKKIQEGYDKKKKCYIVDTKKLNKEILKEINKVKKKQPTGVIIDSHLSHHLPSKYVDLCIVTKCNLKTLENRLKKKKYPKSKIRENLDCEIFDICYNEALENKHKVKVAYTDKKIDFNQIIKSLKLN